MPHKKWHCQPWQRVTNLTNFCPLPCMHITQHLATVCTREDILVYFIILRRAVMKALQLSYECWPEVTKPKWYHKDMWITNETYYWARIKAHFPTVVTLGFDRGKMNRAILTHSDSTTLDDFTESHHSDQLLAGNKWLQSLWQQSLQESMGIQCYSPRRAK
jgi:hypothetical protein